MGRNQVSASPLFINTAVGIGDRRGKKGGQTRRNETASDPVYFALRQLTRAHAGEHTIIVFLRHRFTPFADFGFLLQISQVEIKPAR